MTEQNVIIPVPLAGVKSRYEPTPALKNEKGEFIDCLVVQIPIEDKAKIKKAKKEGDAFVQGSKGLQEWFDRMKREYKIVG